MEILKEYPNANQDELEYYFDKYVSKMKLKTTKLKKLKYNGEKRIDKSN